jgi:hypothetical protein
MQLINRLKGLREWYPSVRSMQIENVNTIRAQFLQARLKVRGEYIRLVRNVC